MYLFLIVFVVLLIVYLAYRLRTSGRAYLEMNETDWKINLLPKPSLFVRLFNIIFGKRSAAVLVTLIQKTAIASALKKSLKQMEEAEAGGTVPTILCDASARQAMQARMADLADDYRASDTPNAFAKVSNYAGSTHFLANHAGLLKLGMTANEEVVRDPVFIVSMPRTATTILHRTMATDTSRWRAFDLADMMPPLAAHPPPGPCRPRRTGRAGAEELHRPDQMALFRLVRMS